VQRIFLTFSSFLPTWKAGYNLEEEEEASRPELGSRLRDTSMDALFAQHKASIQAIMDGIGTKILFC